MSCAIRASSVIFLRYNGIDFALLYHLVYVIDFGYTGLIYNWIVTILNGLITSYRRLQLIFLILDLLTATWL